MYTITHISKRKYENKRRHKHVIDWKCAKFFTKSESKWERNEKKKQTVHANTDTAHSCYSRMYTVRWMNSVKSPNEPNVLLQRMSVRLAAMQLDKNSDIFENDFYRNVLSSVWCFISTIFFAYNHIFAYSV